VPALRPRRGQILVRVTAAALNPKDVLVRKGRFRFFSGRSFPRRMGYDWAGVVEAVGPGVHDVAPGERLFGMVQAWSGGALAEKLAVERTECARAPRTVDDVGAASLPLVSLTALQALRDLGRVKSGDQVGIHGASGGVGTVAIQIARALGATVTTTSSAANRDLCLSLGADEALDYASEDAFDGTRSFDVIVDVFGNRCLDEVRRALAPAGTYLSTVPSRRVILDTVRTVLRSRRARGKIVLRIE
jgi:NADPH:quinone reductase-like Zn-dependent oxidoreductase